MITILKHFIYEYAINILFDKVGINFHIHSPSQYKVGDSLRTLKINKHFPDNISIEFSREYNLRDIEIYSYTYYKVIVLSVEPNGINIKADKLRIIAYDKNYHIIDELIVLGNSLTYEFIPYNMMVK